MEYGQSRSQDGFGFDVRMRGSRQVGSERQIRSSRRGCRRFFLEGEGRAGENALEWGLFPCFRQKTGYIARHLTRKHG
jgi:hypothetical protein